MRRDLSRQLEYVNALGIPFAIIVGPKEIKAKKFTLRDMKTGKERKLTINKLIKSLK